MLDNSNDLESGNCHVGCREAAVATAAVLEVEVARRCVGRRADRRNAVIVELGRIRNNGKRKENSKEQAKREQK